MKTHLHYIQANIWKLYVIRALQNFVPMLPIFVLFLQENGLSLTDVFILQALFNVAVTLLEIPSGYFSDVMGRKISLILGAVLGFFGFFIYCFGVGFWSFLCAELVLALGLSFISGADSALLYDSLLKLGRETEYQRYEGRLSFYGNLSLAGSSILGGYLATFSLRLPVYVETGVLFLAIFVTLSLVEIGQKKYQPKGKNTVSGMWEIVQYALKERPLIRLLILFSGVVTASTFTMIWFKQPWMSAAGIPLVYFGIVWAVLQVASGVFSLAAHSIERHLRMRWSLASLVLIVSLGYFGVACFQNFWAIGFLLCFHCVWGIGRVIFKDYLNQRIPSDRRATVLSLQNMASRAVFVIVGPFVGWIADIYSLPVALGLSGLLFFVLGMVCLFVFLRLRDSHPVSLPSEA